MACWDGAVYAKAVSLIWVSSTNLLAHTPRHRLLTFYMKIKYDDL